MINICKAGDKRKHHFIVKPEHFPAFGNKVVHRVCSTYVLAREIEWSTRLFVLDMLEKDEEGIGTMISIQHISPAMEGNEVIIEAEVESMKGNELICSVTVKTGTRQIASGKTGQRIVKKDKLEQIFSQISNGGNG